MLWLRSYLKNKSFIANYPKAQIGKGEAAVVAVVTCHTLSSTIYVLYYMLSSSNNNYFLKTNTFESSIAQVISRSPKLE